MIYEKNLTQTVRLRLSDAQFAFLQALAEKRGSSISAQIRAIIDEYDRSLRTVDALKKVFDSGVLEKIGKGGVMSNGDTETDQHNLV